MVSSQTAPTAVLLDALGTLVELEPPWPRLIDLLRSRHGIEVEWDEAKTAFLAEMSYYKQHHDEGRDPKSLVELRQRCARVLQEQLPAVSKLTADQATELLLESLEFRPYPEVAEALARLRAMNLRLAIVSNWDISLEEKLAELGLSGLVDDVVVSAQAGARKPSPEIFLEALRRLGVRPDQAIFVGDSPETDIAGAAAAGIRPLLLDRTGKASDRAEVAEISSLSELPELVSARLP